MQNIVRIELKNFLPWFEEKLDHKYNLQQIKTLFLAFLSLSRQLIHLYLSIDQNIPSNLPLTSPLLQVYKNTKLVTSNSIFLINSMTQGMPTCIDLGFCDRFTKQFEQKLNSLCCYYHSLGHLDEQLGLIFKWQRDTIAEGINKLYQLTGSIKDEIKDCFIPLKTLSDYKKLFSSKIAGLLNHIQQFQHAESFFKNFGNASLDYQKSLNAILKQAQKDDEAKSNFMAVYFELLHHCYATQVELESLLQHPIGICQFIKAKKKENVLTSDPQWNNQLSRYLNTLLKPNFMSKHLKKIKIQQFMHFLRIVCSQKQFLTTVEQQGFQFQQVETHLREIMEIMQEDLRELEKVDKSEITSLICDYRDKFVAPELKKKFVDKLVEYQSWMYRYYKVNEQFKNLQKIAQTIVAKEIKLKVELFLSL